jgi:hypothetical protein
MVKECWGDLGGGEEIVLTVSQLALGSTEPSIQLGTRNFFLRYKASGALS